ncbi:MAG: alpha-2-macroglobulin family protein [Azoarcus sp.]|nr:alpha-2-macroglobulin family protein [Azoarcus sp.]
MNSSISRGFSFLALAAILLFASAPAAAQAQDDDGADAAINDASRYTPPASLPFFVLTDTQYGSAEEALLRVEIPNNDGGGLETIGQYDGIDIRLYRVPEPLDFLKAQKSLHRIDVEARPRDEGIANTLSYLWSNTWNKSRRAWRALFAERARSTVTAAVPALKTRFASPEYRPATLFKPLAGYELAAEFRYPLMVAATIDPLENNKGVHLAGSSSNFIPPREGNYHVPLGKLKPGLYIAEAILGTHRALTLVFVADTVAVTKIASNSLTVWTAHRATGAAVAEAKLQWTDGHGVLVSGKTDAQGLIAFAHVSPERTYLLGEDAAGGVFVSENFYYDSEIYDTKLYAITDRPLYRPGESVNIKLIAREYRAANESVPAQAATVDIQVFDANGTPVFTGQTPLASDRGGNTAFHLPADAIAGGYEIRVGYKDKKYSAAFRVAEYVKPHFEIALIPDRDNFKTGEPVSGKIRLTYPNGDAVKNAAIELTLRAQALTMVQGELRYGGQFPVALSTTTLNADEQGEATFSLPPAKEPSRLILSMLATDGAAYRVRNSRELLVERAAVNWKLLADRKFTLVGEPLKLRLEAETPDAEKIALPAQWEIIRLENQEKSSGAFDPAAREWTPNISQPGSYSLLLRDDKGNIVAAVAHWVGGNGVEAIPGTIEMVPNKERYQPGETAEVLITFSEPVDEALLTLERDKVETTALLSSTTNAKWVSAERLAPNQWRARVPLNASHAPNMTFSALYVKNGEYIFQNAGLVVEVPRIALDIKTNKETVKPGETVTVDIDATLLGQPAQAVLTVSVVDEMIYALQPEIAPDVVEFFQHVRRNNVRTGASLNFITYDEAADYAKDAAMHPPARHQYNERAIKILERARRDDTDTAAWQPALVTDENGHARFSFKMPDALSRWRITVRATALDKPKQAGGVYGQRIAYVHSDQPLYAKWTSPTWMREDDAPVAALAVFNNSAEARAAEIILTVAGQTQTQKATLSRGVTYLPFNLPKFTGNQIARLEVRENGQLADALETPLAADAVAWRGMQERLIEVDQDGPTALDLPADARRVSLRLSTGAAEHFLRIADSLIDYPWGCVEQTSSRLIPLAIITPLLAPERARGMGGRLRQTLSSQRLRLAALAGPNAVFGWWGDATDNSALMTAYAYYADWHAAQALGISLPAAHWEHVLAIYSEYADKEPLLHRVLALWFIQQIGLPVRTQAEGLVANLAKASAKPAGRPTPAAEETDDESFYSPILSTPDSALGLAYARVLVAVIAREAELGATIAKLDDARERLRASAHASARALLLLAGEAPSATVASTLASASASTPTLDRALTLVWTQKALGGALAVRDNAAIQPVDRDWQVDTDSRFGQKIWRWPSDQPLPASLTLDKASAASMVALRFDARESSDSTLPVTIERQIFRLERRDFKEGKASYAAVPVPPGEALSAQNLYLDEIHLEASSTLHYGIVEIPLPPGANIERGTWGVSLIDPEADPENNATPIARSRAEEHRDRYGVPIEYLTPDAPVVLRHLLRVGQTGHFVLPPVRYWRMYQPAQKAYAEGGNVSWEVK